MQWVHDHSTQILPPHVLAVTLALLAGTVLSACSAPGTDAGGSTGPAPTSASDETIRERAIALGKCLRGKGLDVSDDDLAAGKLSIPPGVDQETFLQANEACADQAGGGAGGAQAPAEARGPGPEFAECVRDAGFPDFPDDAEGQADFRPSDAASYDEAVETCLAKTDGSSDQG